MICGYIQCTIVCKTCPIELDDILYKHRVTSNPCLGSLTAPVLGMKVKQGKERNDNKPINYYINEKVLSRGLSWYPCWKGYLPKLSKVRSFPVIRSFKQVLSIEACFHNIKNKAMDDITSNLATFCFKNTITRQKKFFIFFPKKNHNFEHLIMEIVLIHKTYFSGKILSQLIRIACTFPSGSSSVS